MTWRIRQFGPIAVFIELLLLTVGTNFPIWERFQDKALTARPDSYIAVATETKGGVYRYSFSSSGPVEFWAENRENYALVESKKDFAHLDYKVDAIKGDGEIQMPPGDVLYLELENHGSVNMNATLTLTRTSQQTVAMTSALRIIRAANAVVEIAFIVFRRKGYE